MWINDACRKLKHVLCSSLLFEIFPLGGLFSTSFCIMSGAFETFWRPFVRVFQVVCVCHFSIYRPVLRGNFIKSLPFVGYFAVFATAHLTLIFTVTSKESVEPNKKSNEHRETILMYYINALSIVSNHAIHITILIENLFHGKREQEICDRFQGINDIFAEKFDYNIDYKMRRAKYLRQTILGFGCLFTFVAVSTFTPLPEMYDDKFFMPPILILSVIVSNFRWCQIALFLNLVADTLDDLQTVIKQQQINQPTEIELNDAREKIIYYRQIYSNVWLITTLLSECFGWTLIVYLAKVVLEFINGAYWAYINLGLHQSTGLNVRKYTFSHFFCLFFIESLFWIKNSYLLTYFT